MVDGLAGDSQTDARQISVELLETKAVLLANAGRFKAQMAVLGEITNRFGGDSDKQVAHHVAFALVTKTREQADAHRPDEAVKTDVELLAFFERQPDGHNLSGMGEMLLDACLRLLAYDRDAEVLAIAQTLDGRMATMNRSRQAIAAGALFFIGIAATRLELGDVPQRAFERLAGTGEPGLVALDRAAARFGDDEANAVWQGQILLSRVSILSACAGWMRPRKQPTKRRPNSLTSETKRQNASSRKFAPNWPISRLARARLIRRGPVQSKNPPRGLSARSVAHRMLVSIVER